MVVIPEELKNLECCLKCRKVDVEFIIDTVKIPSESGGVEKPIKRCKECSDHVYSYNGTLSMASKSMLFIVSLFLSIGITVVGYLEGIKFNHLLIADVVIFFLFALVYINNSYYHRKLKIFLKDYVKANN